MQKEYLGDGVYVEPSLGQVVLTTENGISVTNTIYLDPEIIINLMRYFISIGYNHGHK